MGQFRFLVTNELISLIPELTEHNYKAGDVISVLGQTYSPCNLVEVSQDLKNENVVRDVVADDGPGGSDPTKPRGKYP